MLILKRTPIVDPFLYGAKGDGVTNDQPALQSAATAAASSGAYLKLPPIGVFAMSSPVRLRNGIRGLISDGGTLVSIGGSSVVLVDEPLQGAPAYAKNITIDGIKVDVRFRDAVNAIVLNSTRSCIVSGNEITNSGATGSAILLAVIAAGRSPSVANLVRGNTIRNQFHHGGAGIRVSGYMGFGVAGSAAAKWEADYDLGTDMVQSLSNMIIGNDVEGWYYSVSVTTAIGTRIEHNRCRNNYRNLSLQNRTDRSIVRFNDCRESLSSGIHLAYQSVDNLIEDNTINSARANGEGLLQSYVGSKRNVFRRNKTIITSPEGPKWHAYCGVQSDDCRWEDNEFTGNAQRAYMAVESAWSINANNPAHRCYQTTEDNNYSGAGISGVQMLRNRVTGTSAVPLVFSSQVTDSNGTWTQTGTVLNGNTTTGGQIVEKFGSPAGSGSNW